MYTWGTLQQFVYLGPLRVYKQTSSLTLRDDIKWKDHYERNYFFYSALPGICPGNTGCFFTFFHAA